MYRHAAGGGSIGFRLNDRAGGARFATRARLGRRPENASRRRIETYFYKDASMKTETGEDVLRVLDDGIVVAGEVQVQLLGLKVLPVKVNLVISSVARAEDLGLSWWDKTAGTRGAEAPRAGGVPLHRNGKRHPRPRA
jgi:hypothetical protein